jgi:putative ABC transport system permease protein
VKNFHFESLRKNIDPLCLSIGNSNGKLAVKINSDNLPNTVANIEQIWKRIVPGQPFNYSFMEESFNHTYQAEHRLGSIFTVFTILSILIACLGLFGLAAFNAEKRSKEIGIRKVLGASVSQITYKLSIDFLKLVGIAILISLPLAWYAMNKWLEDFSYRIEIGWGVFALATILAITISILTVSYQSIKAAIVNPIKSLRTE